MEIKVLAFAGSPRRGGNSETLLDWVLSSMAEEDGVVIEKIPLTEANVNPCRGCNACHKTGECVVKDDAIPLFNRILAAECLAVASPIYSMGITAELKGLIDRAQFIWARKFILKNLYFPNEQIRRHKGIFISTAGLSWDNVFDAAFPAVTAFFNTLGFEYYDNIIANDMDRYQGIRGHPTAIAEAKKKGTEVVLLLEKMKEEEAST
ncbi:MAG TPA: flavodoxin family protein [Methanolinea sp.]|nr:flavodoxin family protein [Methanolinea sp.]